MAMKAAQRRQSIVNAGLALFKERGYDAVSVDDICKKAQVTKPTFYNHISSKQMILVEYFQQKTEEALPAAKELLDDDKPAVAFQRLLNTFHGITEEMGPELYAVYRTYMFKDPGYSSSQSTSMEKMIVDCLRMMQEKGYIENIDTPEHLASAILELNNGLAIIWAAKNGAFDYAEIFLQWCRNILSIREAAPEYLLPIEKAPLNRYRDPTPVQADPSAL